MVAFNNSTTAQNADIPTFYGSGAQFDLVLADGGAAAASLATGATGALSVSVPPTGLVIYKAAQPIAPSAAAPAVGIANLVNDQQVELGFQEIDNSGVTVPKRMEIAANVAGSQFDEVTFAVRAAGTQDFTVIGVDDNAPYRVFYDASKWPAGTKLEFLAAANDLNGHYSGAFVGGITANYVQTPQLATYKYAVVHYNRPAGDYDGWGLHLWGDAIDPTEATDWATPKPFQGEDAYGRFAWIKLADATKDVNFIVHNGNDKDTPNDRKFNPAGDSPEIWLKQGDANFYTSQAAAQGFVTIHYNRPDNNYAGWGLHLWGDAIDPSEATQWGAPKPPTGTDEFGAYWNVKIQDATKPVNFIIHNGDNKDPGPDQSLNPADTASVWIKSGNSTIFPQFCAATDQAILHYHRPAGDYGDYTSTNYNDFWGLHTWGAAADPGWTTPRKPAALDTFGPVFRVPLIDTTQNMNYILHRGDTKDPGPDQTLDTKKYGCEVWQVQGADPAEPYILPIIRGAVSKGDLGLQAAQWIDRSTIMWKIEPKPGYSYALHYAPDGGLVLANNQISGGQSIPLFVDPAGMNDAQKAQWPQLAGYTMFRLRCAGSRAGARHPERPDGRRGRPAGPGCGRHRSPDSGRAGRPVHLHRCTRSDLERQHSHGRSLGAHGQVRQSPPV